MPWGSPEKVQDIVDRRTTVGSETGPEVIQSYVSISNSNVIIVQLFL